MPAEGIGAEASLDDDGWGSDAGAVHVHLQAIDEEEVAGDGVVGLKRDGGGGFQMAMESWRGM